MLMKIGGLARAIAIILAIVAGFVALNMMNVPLVLVVLGLVFDPAIGADDRLDPGRARSAVELDQAEKVGRVGERERRHVVLRRALHRVVDPDYAVAHRVLAMHPQVNETRPCHVKKFSPERPP